jgi:LIVCS family branched-chain amino acid:cation transporter
LAAVFTDFLHRDLSNEKVGYIPCLLLTLMITFLIANLNFNGIVTLLTPVLHVCYPALIMLSLVNILYKLYHFKPVKVPVFLVFMGSLMSYFLF